MELPRKILIGSAVIVGLGDFIHGSLPLFSRVAFISGEIVKEKDPSNIPKVHERCSLSEYKWFVAQTPIWMKQKIKLEHFRSIPLML